MRSYATSDPAVAMKYIHKVIDRYNVDGLSFQRCLRTTAEGVGDDILANNAMAIVGLYRDIYGVCPRHDRLFLDPHLTPELNGTRLLYPLRGTGVHHRPRDRPRHDLRERGVGHIRSSLRRRHRRERRPVLLRD